MKFPRFPYARHVHGTPAESIPALWCENVTVRYAHSDQPAVKNLSLTVPQGSRTALIGANGAGKSTILKAIAGLLPVAAGQIRVHGSPSRGCCHRLAYLAQRSDLDWRFPMTVRRLVLTGRYVHLGWFARPTSKDYDIVDENLALLEIADLADRRIGELSGGQQQRALLARAIAQEADLLLLDEPMNAVDARTRTIVKTVLRQLASAGKTIVVATHDTQDIEIEFEKVIHLSSGSLAFEHAGPCGADERIIPPVTEAL